MRLLIASTNPGKISEFRQMLGGPEGAGDSGIELKDLREFQAPVVEETGRTFTANACLKASAYALATQMWALADDSGLAVDALEGKPGVHSARWAEMNNAGRGDADNNALLLRQLEHVPDQDRTARFVCVLALADPMGRIILTAADTVEGKILREGRGINGFGYDPLFLVEELGRTTAELLPADKHRLSHRGKALARLRRIMENRGIFQSGAFPSRLTAHEQDPGGRQQPLGGGKSH